MTDRAQIALVALVGLVIGAVAAVTTATEGTSPGPDLNLIGHSAEVAAQAGSARAEYTMSISMGSDANTGFAGEAAFDFATQAFQMTMDLEAPGVGSFDTEMRLVDGVMFMRLPAGLGAPTPWMSLDITEVAGDDALAGLGTGTDIVQTLAYLRGAGEVTEVGRDEVRGVPTTHYRAELDLGRAIQNVPDDQRDQLEAAVEQFELVAGEASMPADVWIDDDGLPRRMSYRIEIDGGPMADQLPGGGSMTMAFTMDVFDYGLPVSVVAPPPEQVTDMTADLDRFSGLGTF